LQQADAVVITTPDLEFQALRPTDFPQKDTPIIVYDCWRILREKLETASHVRYIPLGVSIDEKANRAGPLISLWGNSHETDLCK